LWRKTGDFLHMQIATKYLATTAFAALFLLAGCKPTGSVRSPEDYLPYVSMALEAAGTAASFGQAEAIRKRGFSACVTTGVLESAFDTASDAVVGAATKNEQIPAVDVDVSACLEFAPSEANGKELSDEVKDLIDAWASTSVKQARFFVEKLEGADCKGHQGGTAALNYVEQVLEPIVEEISEPDGKLTLPAVPIDLAACEE
jgi:hypothetical protein